MKLANKTRAALLAGVLLACSSGAGLAQSLPVSPAAQYQPRSERGALVAGIVRRWAGHVQRIYGTPPQRWAQTMGPTFARAPLVNLKRAASMPDYEAMMAAVSEPFPHIAETAAKAPPVSVKAFYPQTDRLLYTMLSPCRLADTRTVARRLYAGEARVFNTDTMLTQQGGANGGCGLPSDASAVTLNITVVDPGTAGYLTVYPTGGVRPLASSLNYRNGDIVGNEIIARIGGDNLPSFTLYSYAAADVVIDVAGYFSPTKNEPLNCTTVYSLNVTIPPGGTDAAITPACPAGSTLSGGGCSSVDLYPSVNGVYFHSFGPRADGRYACYARNRATTSDKITASGMCCRVPSR
ncbi:hypothetical protein [Lysobacter sp. Root604]|uniref:hypothetical protein n=1 Tax=Lysobacter sp. Root604 TaxID=1736568 RepID=UPI0006F4168B|nr:hypothetical protein [Lysobacter sp. Root604]KRA20412.1 hypothetical protein ASD69_03450 [Lysobacter sp. Root604]